MTATCWKALTSAASSQAEPDTTTWYWVPGWSFDANVFLPLAKQIPGQHFGLCYQSLLELTNGSDFEKATETVARHSVVHANWVGWSLGGAIASAIADSKQANQLTTLATGETFLQQDSISEHGMPGEILDAFEQGLTALQAKTLKRFIGLCASGCLGGRADMRQLAGILSENQIEDANTLMTTLNWLRQFYLPDTKCENQALYADADALNPGGLTPSTNLPGSHAFWLEETNQQAILNILTGAAKPT